jgi:hypothetical protein
MKRLLLVLGFASLLNACSGRSEAPALAKPPAATGGSTSTVPTGGRPHTGGKSGTSTGGKVGTSMGGAGTRTGGATGLGGTKGTSGGASSAGGAAGAGGTQIDAGTEYDAGPINEGPVVKITSPAAPLRTPDDPGTIVDSAVDVLCTVQKSPATGAAEVATSSVRIELLDATGEVVPNQPSVPAMATGNPYEYKAKFTFSSTIVEAGRISFRCSAYDLAPEPLSASDTVATYVDYGPDIKFVLPAKDMAAYPVNSVVPIEIQVDPHPLDATDQASAVADANVSLKVYTTAIALTKNAQGHYVAQVDFSDNTKFPEGLSGVIAASATATNNRKPKGATSVGPINIVLDGTPPVITIKDPTPPANAIIGGVKKICFNVSDGTGSGVNQNTVAVKLDTTAYLYQQPLPNLWTSDAAGNYCFQFNSAGFPNSQAQVTVSIAATDNAGNVTPLVTRQFHLDNVPPFVSLDPPNIRVYRHPDSKTTNCSVSFDPVGSDAANAGSIQATSSGFVRFRAFVWELTNSPPGVDVIWLSGVDDKNVHLYMRPWVDSSTPPVVIDADKDPLNLCDQVDPDLKKSTNSAQTQMMPVQGSEPTGADYSGTDFKNPLPDVSGLGCTTSGIQPDPLCLKTSDMRFVPKEPISGVSGTNLNLTTVYAVNVVDSSLLCAGDQWAISSAGGVPDGWVCVVAEAPDFAGNIGVSAPIAICLDHTNGLSPPACAVSTPVSPPNCATGCKPVSRSLSGDLDTSNNTVVKYDIGNPIPFTIGYLN